MENQMTKFTDIGQFRNVVSAVNKFYGTDKPNLTFEGTVKLHGTNAGVSYHPDTGIYVQSRSRVISVEKDNAGFAFFVEQNREWFEDILKSLYMEGRIVTLFGEWCGGSIQKGVALNQLDKRFVLFALKYTSLDDGEENSYYKPSDPEDLTLISCHERGIFNIYDYPTYTIDIDFNYPQKAQNQIIEWVEEVEKECPYAKAFGVSGVGEGIVFSHFN
jgi:hypothetical protein